jgi:hypothetical protein
VRDPGAREAPHRRSIRGPSPICLPVRAVAHHNQKGGASSNHGPSSDGETRTRTGDTTIFSRARRPAQDGGIPGSHAVSAGTPRSPDVRSLRIFIAACGNGRRLRPKFRLALCGQKTRGRARAWHGPVGRAHSLFRGGGHELGADADDCVSSRASIRRLNSATFACPGGSGSQAGQAGSREAR